MNLRGEFLIVDPSGKASPLIVPNLITRAGAIAILQSIFQNAADGSIWTDSSGDFWIGLCDEPADKEKTMASLTTEPVGNGYARQAVPRTVVDWTPVTAINAEGMESAVVTFTAAGGDFTTISRVFLSGENTQDGSGVLFAFSGALPQPIIIADTESRDVSYRFFLE